MRQLIYAICAAMFMSTITGPANSADQNPSEEKRKVDKTTGHSSKEEADYLAAVKKCEGMQPKEKQSCVEAAKERYGEMLR